MLLSKRTLLRQPAHGCIPAEKPARIGVSIWQGTKVILVAPHNARDPEEH